MANDLQRATTISYTISSRGGVWDLAPMELELLNQADRLGGGCWLLTIPRCRRSASARLVSGSISIGSWQDGKLPNVGLAGTCARRGAGDDCIASLSAREPDKRRPRLKRAGVAVEYPTPRSKPEISLAEIDRAMAAGVRIVCVLADAGYALSAPFRQRCTARGLSF